MLSFAFLPSSTAVDPEAENGGGGPALAVLSTSPGGGKILTSYTLNLAAKELDESTAPIQETQLADAGSETLVAVEGGVIVVGEESVTFFPISSPAKVEVESPGKGKGKAAEKPSKQDGGKKISAKMPVSRVTACVYLFLSSFRGFY